MGVPRGGGGSDFETQYKWNPFDDTFKLTTPN